MTSFYQVDESGGTSAVTLGEASEGSAIQDQYHEDVLTSNLDFDTIVDAGIYRYESIGDSSQHVPSDASSGYVFVFVENDKHSMRSIVQIAFDDNGGVLVRRGAISDTGTTIGAWEDLNASGSSTFAISSTSPAGTVGGSWSVVSGYEDVGIWKQVNIIMTLADAVNTTILLDVATFALSGTQTIYVSNGDGTFSPIILDIVNGGTGANSAAGARTALGAASQADLDSLRDSVNRLDDFSFWLPNAGRGSLKEDLSPSTTLLGIHLYSVYNAGVIEGLPSHWDGWLITFKSMGQVRHFFFRNNELNITYRAGTDGETTWRDNWRQFSYDSGDLG